MVEHLVWVQGVACSNRVVPILLLCGCSSMVELQPSKLIAWVRFPSPAPIIKLPSPWRSRAFFICIFFHLILSIGNWCSVLGHAKNTNSKKDTLLQECGFVVKTAVRIRSALGNRMQLTDEPQIDWPAVHISPHERKNVHR